MSVHPENSPELNEVIDFVEKQRTCFVWCEGCQMERVMNAVYLPYIPDATIRDCRFCRDVKVIDFGG